MISATHMTNESWRTCRRGRSRHNFAGPSKTITRQSFISLTSIRSIAATLVTILLIHHQLAYSLQHHSSHRSPKPSTGGPSSLCHQSWYNIGQKCYKINYTMRTLEASRSRCRDLSAELVTIDDDSQQTKEEEARGGGVVNPSQNLTNDIAILTSNITPDMSNKLFYVNIGPNLLKQYKQMEINNRQANNGDFSESIETDLIPSEWWIQRDEASNFSSYRFDATENPAETPGFALARTKDRWGLLPILPIKKAGFLCEMPAPRHHKANHPPRAFSEHQSSDTRRNPEVVNYHHHQATSTSSSIASPHETPLNAAPDLRKTFSDKDPASSSPQTPPAPQQDVITSALFRDIPQNQSVVMGSTSEMRCSPIDNDSISTWTFEGRNLTLSNRIKLHPNGTLRIEHVRNTDGGNYTCTIHSGGITESRSARLEIIQRPHQPEYVDAKLLDKISTSVRVEWTPGFNGNSPIIKYLVEMRTVTNENIENDLVAIMQSNQWEIAKANISADTTNVIIQDLKPARKYIFRVKAANRIGTSDPSMPTRHPIEVPVQPPSMAPENLSGTPRSSTSISVQWLPPPSDSQNGVIKAYKIRHKLAGYASDTDWLTNDVPEVAHLNFVLDDLITWQNYEIQVAAENDKGVGPYSSSIFVRTKEGKPDKGPRNVAADAISSTKIKITWNSPPPEHINGINLGYRVEIWHDAQHTQLAKESTVPHNGLTPLQATAIDGLSPHTDYYITIKCYTSAGDGVPNEDQVVVKTKQDLPEAVQALEFADVLDKSLRVIWKPPKRINGDLSQYMLEYWESGIEKKSSKIFPPSINEARISDLNPQTLYIFRLYAFTDVGRGPEKTNQTKTSVPPVLPEPPSKLTPINVGPYSVTIQFEPGFDGNAAIDKWVAEAQMASIGNYESRWQIVYISTNHTHNSNSVVVRNLRPFTKYKIRLIPVNIAGQSRYPSEATPEFITKHVEPEQPPKDLTLEDVKSNSALARWSPLSNTNWSGIPYGYNLTWVESNNSSVNYQMINDTRADSLLIRDLEEFTEYTFRIYAVNDAGPSPPSEPVQIMTLEEVPSSGPTNVTARALTSTSISVDWNAIPKRHRNGIIRGYKIQYQAVKSGAPIQYKSIDENSTRHVILNDLKPFTFYQLAVAAYTSVGDGVYGPTISAQTLEDTPGLPQNVSTPTVSLNSARILWDPPEDANGDILGYRVSYHPLTEGSNHKDIASQELQQNERTFKATGLTPNTHYVFTVTAKTKEGWGQQASTLVYTSDSEMRANLPFYREGWFVILCACLSVVITIIVTAILFIQTKSYKYKQDAIKSTSQDRLGDAGFTIDDDPGSHYNNGFGLLSNSANHRRSNGAISQSTANFTLPKTPPRPHPGTVIDSDDGDDDVFEDNMDKHGVKSVAGTSNYDSSGDSITEKPSEISSSPAPESESADDEYVNMANRHFVNHYANVNGTLRSQRSWKKNGPSSSAAISSKHYTSNSHRTKPKLPQRPAPSVPQVPADHSQSSSDNVSSQPVAGTSGTQNHMFSRTNGVAPASTTLYHDSQTMNKNVQQQQQHQPELNNRTLPHGHSQQNNGSLVDSAPKETIPWMQLQQKNTHYQSQQQIDLLNNNHSVNLNGGRIIVDNMAGSRAPLPGFTSFV
uniref:Protein sidekick n=1 Tax=Aceria tosichella TaxID=561515 RepID=A0A6G1S442_9ACAR